MPTIADISDAEASFLEAIREIGADFEMIITRKNGQWFVTMKLPSIEDEARLGERCDFLRGVGGCEALVVGRDAFQTTLEH